MNALELFKREILRPLVTLAIPGAIALVPFIYIFFLLVPSIRGFYNSHETASIFLLFIIALTIGLILEDIGSRLEDIFFHQIKEGVSAWEEYLALANDEKNLKNGEKYLSSIVLRMKFEFGIIVSILFFLIPGLILAFRINEHLGYFPNINHFKHYIYAFCGFLIIYLLFEGISSVVVLHNTRVAVVHHDSRGNRDSKKVYFKNNKLKNVGKKDLSIVVGVIIIGIFIVFICAASCLKLPNIIVIDEPPLNIQYVQGDIVNIKAHSNHKIVKVSVYIDGKDNEINTEKQKAIELLDLNKKTIVKGFESDYNDDYIGNLWFNTYCFNSLGIRRLSLEGYDEQDNVIAKGSVNIKISDADR